MNLSGSYHGRPFNVVFESVHRWTRGDCKFPVVYAISGLNTNISLDPSLYVGSTNNGNKRLIQHFSDLKVRNGRENGHLQNFYNKYGENEITVLILSTGTFSNIREREQNWLDCYNSNFNHKVLFNFAETVENYIISDETRRKISEAVKKRDITGSRNPFWGKTHSPETKAYLSKINMGRTCNCIWTPEKLERWREMNSGKNNPRWGIPHTKQVILNLIAKNRKHESGYYSLISPDGVVYKNIEDISEFCRKFNLDRRHINRVLKGERYRSKKWKRFNEKKS